MIRKAKRIIHLFLSQKTENQKEGLAKQTGNLGTNILPGNARKIIPIYTKN